MNDRLTLRQWWALLAFLVVEKFYLVYGLIVCAKLLFILILLIPIGIHFSWPFSLLVESNAALILFGLPLALFLPLHDLALDARYALLPLSRTRLARVTWCSRILVAPAFLTMLTALFVLYVDYDDFQLLSMSAVAFVTLMSFLGTWAWLLHPKVKPYRYILGPTMLVIWLYIPLDPARWNPLHWVVTPLAVGLGLSSYAAAPVLFARPERALLGEIPQNFYQRCKRWVQEYLDAHASSVHFTNHWPQLIYALALFVSALLISGFNGGLVLTLWYAALFLPLREPWPHDLSIIRSAPVGSHQFIRKTVVHYLLANAVISVLVVPWLGLTAAAWSPEYFMLAVAIVGYGFLARTALWMVMPDRVSSHFLTGLMFVAGVALVNDVVSGYWGQWFERTCHIPLPMDYHQLVRLLAITAPLALGLGAWTLHRVMTRNISIYHGRRSYGNLEFN